MRYFSFISDVTVSTLSHSNPRDDLSTRTADELIVLIDCDRPMAGSLRCRLDGIDQVIIGRGARRHVERTGNRLFIKLPDGRVSTSHATITAEGEAFVLQDAGSKNGIVVNGARATRHILRDGDVLECGRTFFRYRAGCQRPADEPLDLEYADGTQMANGLYTFCEPLARQLRRLDEIARSALPVLISGASGTGKELVARAIHELSQRPGPFVGVNCGALPENLVEAELFGARRGAFTGATEERAGLVRFSHEGTLFLDEVGELPLRAQPTLLRVLQEHEVLAIGATRPVRVDLRVVTATHRNLDLLTQNNQFRADLLARIVGVTIELPRLRDRLDDIGIITAALLARHVGAGRPAPTITVAAMRLLLRYAWPLNVREFEHALRAALTLSSERIDVEHLPAALSTAGNTPAAASTPRPQRKWTPEQQARRDEVEALLIAHQGNISQVARVMGKDRVQIRRWIKMFEIAIDHLVD
ncbi:MAG TPA: sigma 54-interacting transcriptional regulator [Polyangia bacterium]